MKQALTSILFSILLFKLSGQDSLFRPTYVFNGSIITDQGLTLKINMNFLILTDSTIVGSYHYNPSDGSLKLVGRLKENNSFILVERDRKDSITGYFHGVLAADKKAASGKWTSPEKNKYLDFKLSQPEIKSYWDYIRKNRSLYEYSDL